MAPLAMAAVAVAVAIARPAADAARGTDGKASQLVNDTWSILFTEWALGIPLSLATLEFQWDW